MAKYILYRTIGMIVTLFIIMSLVYLITRISMLTTFPPRRTLSEDISIGFQQYIEYLKNIFYHWDWGLTSSGDPVWETISDKIPYTLKINFAAFSFYTIFGIGLGILSAMFKNSIFDKLISTFVLIFSSIPSFILVLFLMLLFGYNLGWLPSLWPLSTWGPTWRALGYVIPVLALSGQPVATLTRHIRGELRESMTEEYLLLAKTKGLSKNQILFRHSLRNSLSPIIPQMPTMFVLVIINSFFVELFYNIPGLAKLFLNNIYQPIFDTGYFLIDSETITAISVIYAGLALVGSLFTDIAYAAIDPRVRVGRKKFDK